MSKVSESFTIYKRWLLANLGELQQSKLFAFVLLWAAVYTVLMGSFFKSLLPNLTYLEVFPRELVFPSVMHATTALLASLALFWLPWLRSHFARLLAGVILALFLIDYDNNLQLVSDPIRALMPGLTGSDPWFVVSLIYLAILFALSIVLARCAEYLATKLKGVNPKDIVSGLLILVAFLFVIPAYSVFKYMITIVPESKAVASEFHKDQQSDQDDKPDIYYIVLDRYTNSSVLKEQLGFDNSQFTSYLENNGFRVNNNAYSNYPYTAMSLSSTLNARYTNDLVEPFKNKETQSRTLYHNLIWQASTARALKKEGYQYHSLGSWYGATYKAPLADVDAIWQNRLTAFGQTKRLRGVEAGEFMRSPYYRIAQMDLASWWPKIEHRDHIANIEEQLTTLKQLSTTEEAGGRFIFAHILSPHGPFVFNGDGSLSANPSTDNAGKPVKQKYLDQITFINSQIQEIVTNIQKQSQGKAVIIINSDEGPHPEILTATFGKPLSDISSETAVLSGDENMSEWSDEWLKLKFGILQAVHIPRATPEDLAQLSSANAFRIVLNRYAGYDLDYLPTCHYGLTQGTKRQYNYADITSRLTGATNDQCEQTSSLPTHK